MERTLASVSGTTIIDLAVDGATVKALIRDVQRHPFRPGIIHVDFYEIHEGETITLDIPIHLVGIPDGVRNGGGVLDQVVREIEIEVLPRHIPEYVELDVSALGIGQSLHVSDLRIENAVVLAEPERTVCTVVAPRVEEVGTEAEEAEGAELEPELIRKAKEDEEEKED
jgi:large subunit ribosomal protein L25